MNRFRLFPPPKLYNKFYGKERRIGVNGGRGERAYNGWTCSFVKERRKRERGSESRSRHHECCWHSRPHVTSPFHVHPASSKCHHDVAPFLLHSPSSPLPRPNGRTAFPAVQCTRAKRGTNHEARRTQNILKLGFYTFEFHGTRATQPNTTGVRLGMGRNEWKTSTDASPRMCPNPCLLSYSILNRGTLRCKGKIKIGRSRSVSSGDSLTLIYRVIAPLLPLFFIVYRETITIINQWCNHIVSFLFFYFFFIERVQREELLLLFF